MTLVPFNKNEIDDIEVDCAKRVSIIKTLIAFIEADHDCVEILNHTYMNAQTCRSAFAVTIKKCGLINIKVRLKGNRVFLIKEQ